jgi:hypothetical protein
MKRTGGTVHFNLITTGIFLVLQFLFWLLINKKMHQASDVF